jgi:DNA/RNA-binding domain of Phe-tRNA-synthetase-like protein
VDRDPERSQTGDHRGFGYDATVVERFPTIRGGVVRAGGLENGPAPSALVERYRSAQREATDRLQTLPIAEHPSIAAWRRVFSAFGAKPTQYRNAAEALLRRLSKQGEIPTISLLVDLGNLVSIRHALPVAVLDLSPVAGEVTVRVADGSEHFDDLGSDGAVHPEPGEVIFVDEAGVVSARRWCWRQSAATATTASTTDALFVVEGHHEDAAAVVASAVHDLVALLAEVQPTSTTEQALLSRETPRWSSAPARPPR